MLRSALARAAAMIGVATAAGASDHDGEDWFVADNVLGIFYHELGHALVDIEGIPIFGQEEDAADVFSIFLIDVLFEEETAVDLAYNAAFGFWAEALLSAQEGFETAWWDVHGPDEQRFYNTVCLFYGAAPEDRDDFAADLDLPEERAETCAEEYWLAAESWGGVLDEISERQDGHEIVFASGDGFAADILRDEIAALNADLRLALPLAVSVEACDEPNAFYDPETTEIVFCAEFEDHLRALYRLMEP
ncbi:DUF4344 domain-containing metallopeptidase [Sinisalibacter lacisalsi]|uniref:Metallopeptidase n=1 Tax=Sinisalibacter lacisalsi TaxID=1526570 RepID=A0ABQ1QS42_9RHOB|nr:DUF4344 domain-containing metallopeptidase [Sinisalibacter lacisalsi]GGD43384.1 hypothetical protein GCM10011358_29020 [Sinisalibacter lacisalsi]